MQQPRGRSRCSGCASRQSAKRALQYYSLANNAGVTFTEIFTEKMTGRGPQVSPAVPGLRGDGPDFTCFGDYSVDLFDRFVGARQKENGRSLLDVVGFAVVKNNVGQFTPSEMGAPSFVTSPQPGRNRTDILEHGWKTIAIPEE
jgi:hypothetical protein